MTAQSESSKLLSVVIAGGRNYKFTDDDIERLNALAVKEVVSGGASGADREGELWAASRGIPVKRFPADWNTHGRAAGPIRNRKMAEHADAVVLFPGGRGTASMRKECNRAGKILHDWTGNTPATPEEALSWLMTLDEELKSLARSRRVRPSVWKMRFGSINEAD